MGDEKVPQRSALWAGVHRFAGLAFMLVVLIAIVVLALWDHDVERERGLGLELAIFLTVFSLVTAGVALIEVTKREDRRDMPTFEQTLAFLRLAASMMIATVLFVVGSMIAISLLWRLIGP